MRLWPRHHHDDDLGPDSLSALRRRSAAIFSVPLPTGLGSAPEPRQEVPTVTQLAKSGPETRRVVPVHPRAAMTRADFATAIDRLRAEAAALDDEGLRDEMVPYLDACYALLTQGRMTLLRTIREERGARGATGRGA